jgi:hypothetical protein
LISAQGVEGCLACRLFFSSKKQSKRYNVLLSSSIHPQHLTATDKGKEILVEDESEEEEDDVEEEESGDEEEVSAAF